MNRVFQLPIMGVKTPMDESLSDLTTVGVDDYAMFDEHHSAKLQKIFHHSPSTLIGDIFELSIINWKGGSSQ